LMDRYVFAEDCVFEDVTASTVRFSARGEQAADCLGRAGIALPADELNAAASGAVVVARSEFAPSGYLVHAPAEQGPELLRRLESAGAQPTGWQSLDDARIRAGIPLWGRDTDEKTIPLEAGLVHALH